MSNDLLDQLVKVAIAVGRARRNEELRLRDLAQPSRYTPLPQEVELAAVLADVEREVAALREQNDQTRGLLWTGLPEQQVDVRVPLLEVAQRVLTRLASERTLRQAAAFPRL